MHSLWRIIVIKLAIWRCPPRFPLIAYTQRVYRNASVPECTTKTVTERSMLRARCLLSKRTHQWESVEDRWIREDLCVCGVSMIHLTIFSCFSHILCSFTWQICSKLTWNRSTTRNEKEIWKKKDLWKSARHARAHMSGDGFGYATGWQSTQNLYRSSVAKWNRNKIIFFTLVRSERFSQSQWYR